MTLPTHLEGSGPPAHLELESNSEFLGSGDDRAFVRLHLDGVLHITQTVHLG